MNLLNIKKELGIIAQLEIDPEPFGKPTFFFLDMFEFGKEIPVEIFIFSPVEWTEQTDKVKCYTLRSGQWISIARSIPKIIYDRFTAKSGLEAKKIEQLREYLKIHNYNFLINPGLADLVKNKLEFHKFLIKNDFPTIDGFSVCELNQDKLSDLFNYNNTIYVKPISGSGGFGISVCEKINTIVILRTFTGNEEIKISELSYILSEKFKNGYFIQSKAKTDFIDNSPYDIRVFIQNSGNKNYKVSGIVVRLGQKDSWVSNLNSGGKGFAFEELEIYFNRTYKIDNIQKLLSNICMDCTLILDSEFGSFAEIAFDVLITFDKGPVILEANSRPARRVFDLIASNYKETDQIFAKYKELRRKTVVLPLIYVENHNFENL